MKYNRDTKRPQIKEIEVAKNATRRKIVRKEYTVSDVKLFKDAF